MESSLDIQFALTNASKNLDSWNAELLRLNQSLATAKVGQRASLRKAIRNAEQQISDLNKQVKRLNDDLVRVAKTEVRNQDKLELAKQGIDTGAKWTDLAGKGLNIVKDLTSNSAPDSIDRTRSTGTTETQADPKKIMGVDAKYIYIAVGLVFLLLMFKKK